MKFKTLTGRSVWKNLSSYRTDWNAPEKSNIQFQVKQFLKPYWERDIVYSEMPIVGTRLRADLVNMTKYIAVETMGEQHHTYNKFFFKNRIGYLGSIRRDSKKRDFFNLNDIFLIEILENEVKKLSYEFFVEKFGVYL